MNENAELRCLSCGYDLRATESGRCPECGSVFDRAQMSRSQVAWENRREMGRLRAWVRRVWQGTFRVREIGDSMSAAVDWYAARRFWLINVMVVYVPMALLLTMGWFILHEEWAKQANFDIMFMFSTPMWIMEIIKPLVGGLTTQGVGWVAVLAFLLCGSGGQSYLFQMTPLSRESQNRAAVLGLYMSGASLGGALIIGLGIALPMVLMGMVWLAWAMDIFVAAMTPIGLAVLFITSWLGAWRLYRRITHAGLLRSMVVGLVIFLWWVLCGVGWLYVFPWGIGMGALIWRSVFG